MATVTRENLGTLHDKIVIKLAKEDYLPFFEKSLKQYAKTATLKGFRKGEVPAGMVRKMVGQSIMNEEVVKTASRQLEEYMRAERLSIFAQPMIHNMGNNNRPDMNKPVDIDFAFEIGIKPDFEIPALRDKANITKYKISIDSRMLDDELERIKRRFGAVEGQDTVIGKDDIIFCTIEESDADGNTTGANKIEETAVLEKMPVQLREKLMGGIAGSVVVFRPADVCTEAELPRFLSDPLKAGPEKAEQYYTLTLSKVGMLIPMEMGFELYEKVFPSAVIKDEADFREKLTVELQKEYDRLTGERYNNEMFEMLVHTTDITLPVPFLKRWLKEGGEQKKTELEVNNEFGAFEHQLRWQLISDKVIMDNNIRISKDEVYEDIKGRVLAYYDMDADDEAPWMDAYMDKVMQEEKMADETFRRLITDKIFKSIATQFTTEEKEIDEKEFFTLPNPHEAHHHHGHQH
ncbi:MAG: trigger factor [Taibaiella sp.]|nr:trigger factor [Taibaiella sp.]